MNPPYFMALLALIGVSLIWFLQLTAAPVFTPTELLAAKDAFAGKTVTVTGTAQSGRIVCTQSVCMSENPCCNTCSAPLIIADAAAHVTLAGVSCKGTNCMVSCPPLEAGKRYTVSGLWNKTLYGEYYLEFATWEP